MNSLSLASGNLSRVLGSNIKPTNISTDSEHASKSKDETFFWVGVFTAFFITLILMCYRSRKEVCSSHDNQDTLNVEMGNVSNDDSIEEFLGSSRRAVLQQYAASLENFTKDLQPLIIKNKDVSEDICSICHEKYDEHVIRLNCNHTFNIGCIEELMKTMNQSMTEHNNNRKVICPLCRQPTSIPKNNSLYSPEESNCSGEDV